MASSDLAVQVARAIKASLDAEGVDFVTAAQDEALHFQRMRRAHERLQRETPDLMHEIRDWYLANHPPLHTEATTEYLSADDFYLAAFQVEHDPWWEILREADGTRIEVPPAPDETDEPPSWQPQPWWDALDYEVRDALVAVQEREGVRTGPDAYDGSGRMLRRFIDEYPRLVAALSERYAQLQEEGEESDEDDAKFGAIGFWMIETVTGDQLVPRPGGSSR
jgi:hypothetical protein